jgi:hypothetical protein
MELAGNTCKVLILSHQGFVDETLAGYHQYPWWITTAGEVWYISTLYALSHTFNVEM